MKNKLFTITALCLSAVVLAACSKDRTTKPNADVNLMPNDPIEKLRTFRKQIESVKAHPEAKSTETITLSEALWDIENTFNLTYSETEQYYSQTKDHEFTLSLPVRDDHDVLVYDAVNLYSDVIVQARNAIISDDFEDKGFISLTVKEANEDSGLMHITFSGKTGERSSYNPPIAHVDGPFGLDDNWLFATPMGKCDDPDIPSGADEQLQEQLYIELIKPFIETDANSRNIYIDRRRFVFDGTNYSGVYYNTDLDNLCIDHVSMNDYYFSEKQIIMRTIPNQYHLYNYSPISIEIHGAPSGDDAVTHRNEIEYGIRMEVSKNEFGDIENLLIQQ